MHLFNEPSTFEKLVETVKTNQSKIIAAAVALALTVGGLSGYLYYKNAREEKSYRAFVNILEHVEGQIKTPGQKSDPEAGLFERKEYASFTEKWEKVAAVSKEAAESLSGTGLAPLFLAYQADALAKLGKLPEAIALTELVVSKASGNELKDAYRIKLALMQMDTKDEKVIQTAIESLQKLAEKSGSSVSDQALFHLGNYYWYAKNFAEAAKYWNELITKFGGKNVTYPSPFVGAAKDKLRLIDSNIE